MQVGLRELVTGYPAGTDVPAVISSVLSASEAWAEIRRTKLAPPPVIRLTVHRAHDLPRADLFSAPDPYVTVRHGEQQTFTSDRAKNTKNPIWEFGVSLRLTDPVIPVTITIFDKDKFTKDDVIDEVELDLADLLSAGNVDQACVKLARKGGELVYSVSGVPATPSPTSQSQSLHGSYVDSDSLTDDLPQLEHVEKMADSKAPETAETRIIDHPPSLEPAGSVFSRREPSLMDQQGNKDEPKMEGDEDWEIVDQSMVDVADPDFTAGQAGFKMNLPSQEDSIDSTSPGAVTETGERMSVSKSPSPAPVAIQAGGQRRQESMISIDRPDDDLSLSEISRSSSSTVAKKTLRKVSSISINLGATSSVTEAKSTTAENIGAISTASFSATHPEAASSSTTTKATKPVASKATLTVHRAKELQKMDTFGKSDPYAVIKHKGSEYTTEVVKKSLNPSWEAGFDLDVSDPNGTIEISLFDWDKVGKNEPMGRLETTVTALAAETETRPRWFNLEDCKSGAILLSLRHTAVASQHFEEENLQIAQPRLENQLSQEIVNTSQRESLQSQSKKILGLIEKSATMEDDGSRVVQRIVRKTTRRVIRRVVVINGVEHVTEEVIEDPESLEVPTNAVAASQSYSEHRKPVSTDPDPLKVRVFKIILLVITIPKSGAVEEFLNPGLLIQPSILIC